MNLLLGCAARLTINQCVSTYTIEIFRLCPVGFDFELQLDAQRAIISFYICLLFPFKSHINYFARERVRT